MATAWNPSDSSAITVSNSPFTGVANVLATSTTQGGVRALVSATTGKYYFEFNAFTFTSGNSGVGIANGSAVLSSFAPSATQACLVYAGGTVYLNGSFTGKSLGSIPSGSVIGVALDLNTYQIWMRVCPSGNWLGVATANPATNVGGLSIAVIASASIPIFPAFGSGTSGEKIVANFGDTNAFSGAVPSGFIAGYPIAGVPASTVGALTQIAVEQWIVPSNPIGEMTQVAVEQWGSVPLRLNEIFSAEFV